MSRHRLKCKGIHTCHLMDSWCVKCHSSCVNIWMCSNHILVQSKCKANLWFWGLKHETLLFHRCYEFKLLWFERGFKLKSCNTSHCYVPLKISYCLFRATNLNQIHSNQQQTCCLCWIFTEICCLCWILWAYYLFVRFESNWIACFNDKTRMFYVLVPLICD